MSKFLQIFLTFQMHKIKNTLGCILLELWKYILPMLNFIYDLPKIPPFSFI